MTARDQTLSSSTKKTSLQNGVFLFTKVPLHAIKNGLEIANIYGSADAGMIACNGRYDPHYFYIEEFKGELLITTDATAPPLIRYNTHDVGGLGKDHTITLQGRTDVAVTFYSSYLYPEHFVKALGTSDYCAYRHISSHGDSFHIVVEARHGTREQIAKKLAHANIEYSKVLESLHAKALPKIHVVADITNFTAPKDAAGILSIKGKKPKMVTA